MMDVLILRLSAPMIALGGAMVDNLGFIREFPALSMLTGMLGNALGYEHRDSIKLQQLQNSLRIAIRCDSPGKKLIDYQTVDLGQEYLKKTGWTTYHKVEERGGDSSEGTHLRYRHYWSDAVYTLAVTLNPLIEGLTIACLEQALLYPARPLFIGRKCCIPAEPIFYGKMYVKSLLEALSSVPLAKQALSMHANLSLPVWCSIEEELLGKVHVFPITDERDWGNQIHCGRRMMQAGTITLKQGEEMR